MKKDLINSKKELGVVVLTVCFRDQHLDTLSLTLLEERKDMFVLGKTNIAIISDAETYYIFNNSVAYMKMKTIKDYSKPVKTETETDTVPPAMFEKYLYQDMI
uniref:Uncharacterized protein n=1 Tax=viral metagenome TaxID=1070528 RepID=A0A6M3JVV6_9ZZZZ